MPTYELIEKCGNNIGIKCLLCSKTSYHPEDLKNFYCGNCHIFHKEKCHACDGYGTHGDDINRGEICKFCKGSGKG